MNAKDTIDIQVSFGMDLKADDVLQLLGVAPKLEKVYTILKELASDKPAESNEPLIDYKIGRSKDAVFEQIKQTPLKEDALETAATVDEPTEKYPDIFGNPEVQKAIAEMKQKPSLFQHIKNWFAN